MKYVLRDLRRRKLRSFLTITGIMLGILALTTMGALSENFNALLDGGVRYFSGNIQVGDENGGGLISIDRLAQVKAVSGVSDAFPSVTIDAKPGEVGGVSFGVPDFVAGYEPDAQRYSSFKLNLAQGRFPGRAGEVTLGSGFAAEFGKRTGDRIDLPRRPKDAKPDFVNRTFTVVGILNRTQTAPDSGAYLTLADAQTLMQDQLPAALRNRIQTSSLATGIVAYGKPGQNLDRLADRITHEVPGVRALEPTTIVNSFKAGGAIFTAITLAAAILALVVGGLSVTNTMIMAVTERTREIGLKKAVGARTGDILKEFLLEATMIGVLAGVVGVLLGSALAALLNLAGAATHQQLFLVTPRLVVVGLLFGTILSCGAGVLPALRAARLDPVRALRSI